MLVRWRTTSFAASSKFDLVRSLSSLHLAAGGAGALHYTNLVVLETYCFVVVVISRGTLATGSNAAQLAVRKACKNASYTAFQLTPGKL